MARSRHHAARVAIAGSLLLILSGCSIDTIIWGQDGARVITTTETLIAEASSDEGQPELCTDTNAEIRDATDWAHLSPGEPEKFHAQFWEDQAALNPTWSINLERDGQESTLGDTYPGDVFYREGDDGLCVVDIAWTTITG